MHGNKLLCVFRRRILEKMFLDLIGVEDQKAATEKKCAEPCVNPIISMIRNSTRNSCRQLFCIKFIHFGKYI